MQGVAPGIYVLSTAKPGFQPSSQPDLVLAPGETAHLDVALQETSFSSLTVIGRTRTTTQTPLNSTPSAVYILNSTELSIQGTNQVIQELNQIPGVVASNATWSGNSNGAAPGSDSLVQIRGALPYETQALIDGHPVSVGYGGSYANGNEYAAGFNASFLNPWFLQNIEVVKGPGYLGPDINYAIAGTVNFRTLLPTAQNKYSIDAQTDQWGGFASNYRATGTTLNGHLGYALDFGTVGTPGPPVGTAYQAGVFFFPNETFNGTNIGTPNPGYALSGASNPRYVGGNYASASTLAACCFNDIMNLNYNSKGELAKLAYNFSPQTSITAAFLGSQIFQSAQGPGGFTDTNNQIFAPGAGYAGSLPAGTQLPFYNAQIPFVDANQISLFELEARTTLGSDNVLGRYYAGANDDNTSTCPTFTTCDDASYSRIATLYGTTPSTIYNGATGRLAYNFAYSLLSQDHLRGYTFEYDHPVGNSVYSVSFDRSEHDDFAGTFYGEGGNANDIVSVPPGSSETFQTVLMKAQFPIANKVQAGIGNYFIDYTSHYTPNGGATFEDVTHGYDAPRAGFTYREDADTSWRLSAGASIAPPTIGIITTPASPPQPAVPGIMPEYYTQQLPAGSVEPETAFSYDLGVDKRVLRGGLLISGDVYKTNVHNQYLNTLTLNGTYTPPSGIEQGITAPLYLQQTQNLGQSRYEGIELALRHRPTFGIGFTLQGSLERAYVYDLPAQFYATGAGPVTTNLGVIPNVNYFGSGDGFNGVGYGRIPYSMGYAELNYGARRFYGEVGVNYYGPNNSYNVPAFGELNGSLRFNVNTRSWLQLSASNILDAYNGKYPNLFGGVPVPLANGKLGYAAQINVGPTVLHLTFHADLGAK